MHGEVISGHQWSSEVISGLQWSSVDISGHQRRVSDAWRGHQWPSVVIKGHQWSSVVIRGAYLRQGEVISLLVGNQSRNLQSRKQCSSREIAPRSCRSPRCPMRACQRVGRWRPTCMQSVAIISGNQWQRASIAARRRLTWCERLLIGRNQRSSEVIRGPQRSDGASLGERLLIGRVSLREVRDRTRCLCARRCVGRSGQPH